MNISETRLFNKKFKLYKNYSHHEKPNIKSLLDELTGRYTNDFSYYIIIDKHYINIYIKSKLYSLYKIINKHYIYYLMDTYDDLFNDDLNIYDSFYITKNKIYNYIQHEDDNIIKYRLKNSLLFLIYNKGIYKDNIYIYCDNYNKYYPYKSKIYNCSNELIKQLYDFITKTVLYFFLIYEYNYIGNYIYGRRNNSKINDKYKFISNWRICILFI